MGDVYLDRLDALDQIWWVWAQLGDGLTEEQWSRATRCPGRDVAALYAHHSGFPLAMSAPPPLVDGPVGEPLTAIEILRLFNAPDGVAHSMAGTVSDGAVSRRPLRTPEGSWLTGSVRIQFIKLEPERSWHRRAARFTRSS
jgi:hypothetical protein